MTQQKNYLPVYCHLYGGSIDKLQMMTDHARRDSVLKYADVKLEAKKNIMANVLKFRAGSGMVQYEKNINNIK